MTLTQEHIITVFDEVCLVEDKIIITILIP